jgi:hypothetical protein
VDISGGAVITCNSEWIQYKWSINPFTNPNHVYSHSPHIHDNIMYKEVAMSYFKIMSIICIKTLVRKTIKFIRDSRNLARGSNRGPSNFYAGLLTTKLRVGPNGVEPLVHF